VALFAAFSFVIMMFNVPLPGGTSGHAVGGALAAIILGPEIAVIAITIALVIQAFFFGDGGILAIGANSFNLAVVLPFTAYAVYQLITRNSALNSKRRIIGAVAAGWAGLTASAFFTAFEFGIQPLLFHTADGTPLYAPYPLSVAIPAMIIPHALVASVVEGVVTALVVAYLMRANPGAFHVVNKVQAGASVGAAKWRGAWAGLAGLALLTPIGLLAPGTAWGEWGAEELSGMGLSFIPQGMQKLSGLWAAPISDYSVPNLGSEQAAYMLSAITGILIIVGLAWLFSFLAANSAKNTPEATPGE
jgi:cobalt/nickel transport system permease protein